jgi:hypothetical protein
LTGGCGGEPTGDEDGYGAGGRVGEFVGFAGFDEEGVAKVERVGFAVECEEGGAFEGDEEFGHVGVDVGGAGFTGREGGAGDLCEGWEVAFAEPDLLLRQGLVAYGFVGEGV